MTDKYGEETETEPERESAGTGTYRGYYMKRNYWFDWSEQAG